MPEGGEGERKGLTVMEGKGGSWDCQERMEKVTSTVGSVNCSRIDHKSWDKGWEGGGGGSGLIGEKGLRLAGPLGRRRGCVGCLKKRQVISGEVKWQEGGKIKNRQVIVETDPFQ